MKKLIKTALLFAFFTLFSASAYALSLSADEAVLMNNIVKFVDTRPEGPGLRQIQLAVSSKNVALQGMASIVLFKHYGRRFQSRFLRSFTLNRRVGMFEQGKKILVKLGSLGKLLDPFNLSLQHLKDERARLVFMFCYFRNKNVYLLSESGEHLSMAVFYRISVFSAILGSNLDAIRLAEQADIKR